MELRVQSEAGFHTVHLRPSDAPGVRGPWAEISQGYRSPFLIVGMAAISPHGGRVKIDVGVGELGEEESRYTVKLPVDAPPFAPRVRGLTEELILPAGQRVAARFVVLD